MNTLECLMRYGAAYHAHLEICAQCEKHPFAQCPVGHVLLNAAGGIVAFYSNADQIMAEVEKEWER